MIQMPWFLPLGLLIGSLLTRSGFQRWRESKQDRRRKDWWLLLLLGWIPLLVWIASQWMEQY